MCSNGAKSYRTTEELERQQRKLQARVEVPRRRSRYRWPAPADKIRGQRADLRPGLASSYANRLIALVRQRLSIHGGCCGFDLPTLHVCGCHHSRRSAAG